LSDLPSFPTRRSSDLGLISPSLGQEVDQESLRIEIQQLKREARFNDSVDALGLRHGRVLDQLNSIEHTALAPLERHLAKFEEALDRKSTRLNSSHVAS